MASRRSLVGQPGRPSLTTLLAILLLATAVLHTAAKSASAAPATPTGLAPGFTSSPGQIISTVTPTLSWTSVSAARYEVSISAYPYGASNIVYNNAYVYGTSVTVPTGRLLDGVTYRWDVRAFDASGWASGFSADLYFRVALPVACSGSCTTSVPATGTVNQSVPFSVVPSTSNCSVPLTYTWTFGDGTSSSAQNPAKVYTAAGTKGWIVSVASGTTTICARSGSIDISAPVAQPPSTPTALSPGTSSSPGEVVANLTPTLSWTNVSAMRYEVSISAYPYGASNIVYNNAYVYGTSVSVPSGRLVDGGQYRWDVRAFGSDGQASGFSADLYFRVALPAACSGSCSTAVPSSGTVNVPIAFGVTPTTSNCTSPVTYAWSFGDGTSSALQNPAHAYTAAGNKSWSLTVTSGSTSVCSRTGTIVVAQPSPEPCVLTCSASADVAEAGTASRFSASVQPAGACTGLRLAWDFGDGTSGTAGTPAFHAYRSAGNYSWSARWAADGGASCVATGVARVAAPCAPPTVTAWPADQQVASGTSARLMVSVAAGPAYTYRWLDQDGALLQTTAVPWFDTPVIRATRRFIVEVVAGCGAKVAGSVTLSVDSDSSVVDAARKSVGMPYQDMVRERGCGSEMLLPSQGCGLPFHGFAYGVCNDVATDAYFVGRTVDLYALVREHARGRRSAYWWSDARSSRDLHHYFKATGQLLPHSAPYEPGDLVFIDDSVRRGKVSQRYCNEAGRAAEPACLCLASPALPVCKTPDGAADHVGVIAEVDANGRPTVIIEAYSPGVGTVERRWNWDGKAEQYVIGHARLSSTASLLVAEALVGPGRVLRLVLPAGTRFRLTNEFGEWITEDEYGFAGNDRVAQHIPRAYVTKDASTTTIEIDDPEGEPRRYSLEVTTTQAASVAVDVALVDGALVASQQLSVRWPGTAYFDLDSSFANGVPRVSAAPVRTRCSLEVPGVLVAAGPAGSSQYLSVPVREVSGVAALRAATVSFAPVVGRAAGTARVPVLSAAVTVIGLAPGGASAIPVTVDLTNATPGDYYSSVWIEDDTGAVWMVPLRVTVHEAEEGSREIAAYLAEGATGDFFDTRIAVLNPADLAVEATVSFMPSAGNVISQAITVPARTRLTIDPETTAGLERAEFSTTVTSPQALVVDRTMSWGAGRYGGHSETAVPGPATTWYLAEGATHSGFDLFYLLQNPNDAAVEVDVKYLLPAPALPVVRRHSIAALSRFTLWVNTQPGLANTDVSAVITSTAPIIAERAMYQGRTRRFDAGHESAGVTAPAPRWFLAEGATGPYFDLFVLIANPTSEEAATRVRYLLPTGETLERMVKVAASSRVTIWVDHDDPRLADTAVSTVVESTNGVPIVVERAMWWPGNGAGWHEAHNSPGATATGVAWAMAEGEQGGADGVETYILVANTSAAQGRARVTLLFEDGTEAAREFALSASSRFNVAVGVEFPEASGRRFGAIVESLGSAPAQLVVERATYWNASGVRWAAGTNALATRLR